MEITISDNDVVTISGVRRNDRIYISFDIKNDLYGAIRDMVMDIDSIDYHYYLNSTIEEMFIKFISLKQCNEKT